MLLFKVVFAMGIAMLFLGGTYNLARYGPEPRKPDPWAVRTNSAAVRLGPKTWRIGAVVTAVGAVGWIITSLLGLD